ncbi:hypothetical protein [Brassicibacter mesophilus]|uniref:hypothetical protein n=1 Tax=Brassicibacter mesophilus TaxID=745119 RepID=UPI003D197230
MDKFFMTLEEKRVILNSFNQLIEVKDEKSGYSYYLNDNDELKLVAKDFSSSGNGYVYGKEVNEYSNQVDNEGWVNVKDFSAKKFRDILHKSVDSQLM